MKKRWELTLAAKKRLIPECHFMHDVSQDGHGKVWHQTIDTVVVVIAMPPFYILEVIELWMAFGVSLDTS